MTIVNRLTVCYIIVTARDNSPGAVNLENIIHRRKRPKAGEIRFCGSRPRPNTGRVEQKEGK